jgi:serine protease Do
MKRWSFAIAGLILGFAIAQFLVGTWTQGQGGPPAPPRELVSYRDVVKKVLPAVVSVEARAKLKPKVQPTAGFGEPPQEDVGSGFLVAPGNVVVTSYHIVQDAAQAVIKLTGGRKLTSKDIRGDSRSDLAVILLDPKGEALPFLEMGDSDAMEIGDHVLAVGAPFGLAGSVTHGIVSGKGRDLNLNLYEDFLQTDAAINPGNSGGPLVNLDGRVVGICAAIKSRSGGFQGVGLTVASNLARGIIDDLRKDGVVRRAYLGLQSRELEPEIAGRLGVPRDGGGIVVAQVFANTPADKAGLQAGDVLTRIDGKSVRSTKALQTLVARLPLGKTVAMEFIRDGKTRTGEAPVEEQPASYANAGVPAPRLFSLNVPSVPVAKVGVELADLTPALAKDLSYPVSVRGVLITRVQPSGLAGEAGLLGGMLITRVEGKAVSSAADARQLLEAAPLNQGVLLQVQSPQGGVSYALLTAP